MWIEHLRVNSLTVNTWIIALPLMVTCAISDCKISESPGTCKLATQVNVLIPGVSTLSDTKLILVALSRELVVILTALLSGLRLCITPDVVSLHSTVLASLTDVGSVAMQVSVKLLCGAISSTVTITGITVTSRLGAAKESANKSLCLQKIYSTSIYTN